MSLVEFNNVYKRYKTGEIVINAVDGISFKVEEGEFAIVVGASGAGKTTVLNILGGMDSCSEGEIIVGGKDISKFKDKQLIEYRRHDIGFVFQFYNLVHNLTAKENVELAAQICSNPLDSETALDSVGLLERANNSLHSFRAVNSREFQSQEHLPKDRSFCFVTNRQVRLTTTRADRF